MSDAFAQTIAQKGADLRYVQQSSRCLGTPGPTGIYRHVNIEKLIEVHGLTHPAGLPAPKPGATCQPAGKGDIITA
ncbi:MAG: hypothetical protein KGJ88_04935 [Verrucomicrobiota bacterium]|nr:hypothetical protein [Verrucomicrobiota bacterium]